MSSFSTHNSMFRQQQDLYRSSHYLATTKQPPLYTPPSPNTVLCKGRKRRGSEDEEMGIAEVLEDNFSSNNIGVDLKTMDTPRIMKRKRTSINKSLPISKLLGTLGKEKLIELIVVLVDANPYLQSEIDGHLGLIPTTQTVSQLIGHLESKLNASYPLHRAGMGRDDYCFARVRPLLLEVVSSLVEYADHFVTNGYPTTAFTYLHFATCTAHRLPTWDSDANNEIKRDLFIELGQNWIKAIDQAAGQVEQGKLLGHHVISDWAEQVDYHHTKHPDVFIKVKDRFTKRLGWTIA